MAIQIQIRRDSAADWTSNDPTLAAGEQGFETDTGQFKIGDGATAWTSLAYAGGSGGTAQVDGTYGIEATAEGATAGNARGENSVDLCTKRSNAAYVPSGICSMNAAGENNGGSGTHSLISGKNNYSNTGNYCNISGYGNYSNTGWYCNISGKSNYSNSGYYCSISGYGNDSNSGDYCSISGGGGFGGGNHSNSGNYCSISGSDNDSNSGYYCNISGRSNYSNTGDYCSISGRLAIDNALDYARVHGGSSKARIIDLVAKCSTANTTPKAITLGGAAEGAAGSIIIPADTAWAFTVHVVAIDVTNGFANSKKFSFDGLVLNDGGTVTVSSATLGTDATQGTFTGSVALSADTTYDALRIMATGISTDTIRWTAQVNLTQVD